MRTGWSRREFLAAAGTTGLLMVTACSGRDDGTPGKQGVTIRHAFGETTVPAAPHRVVSAGFTEQDALLGLGLVPIATTEWFGAEPFAVWPWAQPALGTAQPTVLNLADGIQVDEIRALRPDLIVATNAGCDADTYQKLSEIAPTIAQSGQLAFFEPWKDQATAIGQACFAKDKMAALIQAVDDKFTAAGQANPQFKDKKVLLLQGSTWQNSVIATRPGWRTEFLTQLGFATPELAEYGRDDDGRAYIPLDRVEAALDEADLLIWTTESDAERDALLADPSIAALSATRGNRNVFTGKELAGAIAFSSVLSYPIVADQLPALLATALG